MVMIPSKEIENSDTNTIKEAAAVNTGAGSIRVYTSFGESTHEQYQRWARMSPEDRLSEFFIIMSRFYIFKKPNWKGTKIYIDK